MRRILGETTVRPAQRLRLYAAVKQMKMTVDMKTNKMNLHVLRHGRYFLRLSALVLAVCTPATLVAGFVQQSTKVGFRGLLTPIGLA